MCAIYGLLHASQQQMQAMGAALHHRGPDSRDVVERGSWRLGVNRLAIQDLTASCIYHSACGQITTGCNGEIYNWRELRKELEREGHTFRTQCDSEILPAAWEKWGEDLFIKLNGMFALWIYDSRSSDLIVARDRCGQKPFYYTSRDGFAFASEIRGLSAIGVPTEPDPAMLFDYLQLRYVPEPRTFYRNIEILPAGNFAKVSESGEMDITAYWEPSFSDSNLSEVDRIDELAAATESAIARSSQPDVPFATYLSGGVDSTLLASVLTKSNPPKAAIGLGFGAANDETPVAAATAKRLGVDFHGITVAPGSLADLPRVVAQMERPVGDLLTLAFDALARGARDAGCPVAIGGEGADELFAGYSFTKAHHSIAKMPEWGRKAAAAFVSEAPGSILDRFSGFPASLGRSGRNKVAAYIRSFAKSGTYDRSIGLRSLFSKPELESLLVPELAFSDAATRTDLSCHEDEIDQHLAFQFSSWLQDWSLIRQDKNAMAHSVEYRAPFLDNELLDISFRTPFSLKVRAGTDKYIWREAARRHLPNAPAKAAKVPFYLPLEDASWREAIWKLFDEVLAGGTLEKTGWFRPGAVDRLVCEARDSGEFLPLKQLASLVILSLHLDR